MSVSIEDSLRELIEEHGRISAALKGFEISSHVREHHRNRLLSGAIQRESVPLIDEFEEIQYHIMYLVGGNFG